MPEEAAPIDPTEALEPFGWDDLEDRFVKKMEDCEKQEAAIEKEFAEWCRVRFTSSFLFWLMLSHYLLPFYPRFLFKVINWSPQNSSVGWSPPGLVLQELAEYFVWDFSDTLLLVVLEEPLILGLQVFQAWASTTREYEEERLHKR